MQPDLEFFCVLFYTVFSLVMCLLFYISFFNTGQNDCWKEHLLKLLFFIECDIKCYCSQVSLKHFHYVSVCVVNSYNTVVEVALQ